jgi:phosphoribosylamine--glycine ligase
MGPKILILGGGGREHAMAWALERSGAEVHGFPGNAGFARVHDATGDRVARLRTLIREHRFDFVVLGSEQPAADGETDVIRAEFPDVFVVGPGKSAARLESSKAFAKEFMKKYGVPTADYQVFDEYSAAESHIRRRFEAGAEKIVVKADGLAAGKGVVVADDAASGVAAARAMLDGSMLGAAGARVVIEDYLQGREVSVFVLTDGRDKVFLPPATDYKRRFDGNLGPNTGGMGAVSPPPFFDHATARVVENAIVAPTLAGIRAEGLTYPGFLFFGLMLCDGRPYVLEYNVRLGDPETQAVLPRLTSPGLLDLFVALRDGRLGQTQTDFSPQSAVAVVCVSSGYPAGYKTEEIITGLENVEALTFFAGARRDADGRIRTAGGRVLTFTGMGDDLAQARHHAYRAVASVCFESIDFRKDVGMF